MATVYKAPIDPPVMGYGTEDWKRPATPGGESPNARKEREYLEELRVRALAQASREGRAPGYVGEIVRFPVADGYAQYMVWRQAPLQLIWIELGDAWSAHNALIRGLRLKDVKAQVDADKRLAALFAERKAVKA